MIDPDKQGPLDRLLDAYSVMLERANEYIDKAEEQAKPAFERAVERAQETAHELGELSREEARLVADYLKRDLRDIGQQMADSRTELRSWLRFDVEQIESRLWEAFASIADRTSLELMRFAGEARKRVEYRAGEITGPGTLMCDACGEEVHFGAPAEIPPCPRCRGTLFHRPV
jgi:hypothetical protein